MTNPYQPPQSNVCAKELQKPSWRKRTFLKHLFIFIIALPLYGFIYINMSTLNLLDPYDRINGSLNPLSILVAIFVAALLIAPAIKKFNAQSEARTSLIYSALAWMLLILFAWSIMKNNINLYIIAALTLLLSDLIIGIAAIIFEKKKGLHIYNQGMCQYIFYKPS